MTEKGVCPLDIPECLGSIRTAMVLRSVDEVLDGEE
jgi:hypothetical protein